eukprot:TRINITY_DN2996_c0_g1::TRINITY_DN2996_c0_g1_i1::g.4266::m.4266 TRINITY_DN2996_c0_g1::TRINITY_DN2996_c0_g1_i1::g.4266  ORF type:complete len:449 (+),score=46.57 TRINITY_DN2996_c0_g1_i1:212-1558(+)
MSNKRDKRCGKRHRRRSRNRDCRWRKERAKGTWGKLRDEADIIIPDAPEEDDVEKTESEPTSPHATATSLIHIASVPSEPVTLAQVTFPFPFQPQHHATARSSHKPSLLMLVSPPPFYLDDPVFRATERLIVQWMSLLPNTMVVAKIGRIVDSSCERIPIHKSANTRGGAGDCECLLPKNFSADFQEYVSKSLYWRLTSRLYQLLRKSLTGPVISTPASPPLQSCSMRSSISVLPTESVTYSGLSRDREYIFYDRCEPNSDCVDETPTDEIDTKSTLRLCVNEVGAPSGLYQESVVGDLLVRTGGESDFKITTLDTERLEIPFGWEEWANDADVIRETEKTSYRRNGSMWNVNVIVRKTSRCNCAQCQQKTFEHANDTEPETSSQDIAENPAAEKKINWAHVEHGFEVECADTHRLQHYVWHDRASAQQAILSLLLTVRALIYSSSGS